MSRKSVSAEAAARFHDVRTEDFQNAPEGAAAPAGGAAADSARITGGRQTVPCSANEEACRKLSALYKKLEGKEHEKSVFTSRCIFNFFAEDDGLLGEKKLFLKAMQKAAAPGGIGLQALFENVFAAMRTPQDAMERKSLNAAFQVFPYANGDLFTEKICIPEINEEARKLLLECAALDWSHISLFVFGSMFQTMLETGDAGGRRSGGIHFTAPRNIFKVLRPLFLDELRAELDDIKKISGREERIAALRQYCTRLAGMRFLDPACGSGNFLILAFCAVKWLEVLALKHIKMAGGLEDAPTFGQVSICQFFGIEINSLAAALACVSLHIAERRMLERMQSFLGFSQPLPLLPLRTYHGILNADALTTAWDASGAEGWPERFDYVFGNPPFCGFQHMSKEQKASFRYVFGGREGSGKLDYVAAWFEKSSHVVKRSPATKAAFLSTNSVAQGMHISGLWDPIHARGQEMLFACQSFPWENDLADAAGVSCVAIGFGTANPSVRKLIYPSGWDGRTRPLECAEISPYLTPGPWITVKSARKPQSAGQLPMHVGGTPKDGGHLLIKTRAERDAILQEAPQAAPYIMKFSGAEELVKGQSRWCLWLADAPQEILDLPPVKRRIDRCRAWRLSRDKKETKRLAAKPHLFGDGVTRCQTGSHTLLVPQVTTTNRLYIPIDFARSKMIASNLLFVVHDASLFDFGIATSAMHMAWVEMVCGRMITSFRYNAQLGWNAFPWPMASHSERERIEALAEKVLSERASDKSLEYQYNLENMTPDLKNAHLELDKAVDSLYEKLSFNSNEDRASYLLGLYVKSADSRAGL